MIALFATLALAQDPAPAAPPAAAPAADAPAAAAPAAPADPKVIDMTPPEKANPCKNAAACSNYEIFRPCTGAECDFANDERFLARKVCTEGANGEYLAYCVKPKDPPKSNSGTCICDSGSPSGAWLVSLVMLAVARKRRV